jgi:hypothetical protein
MRNETAAALTLTQGSGANVVIAAGQTKIVATDGAGSGAIVYEMDDLELAGNLTVTGVLDVDGTANLDVIDVDGAANFAADVTFADGADIITASAGTSNFRAGVNAGNSIESGGNYNTVVGDEAGTAITTGDSNIGVGYGAVKAATTGSQNVGVGVNTLATLTTASYNTALGTSALTANTSGANNVAVGTNALDANTTAANNTAVGYDSLGANTTGASNVAVGALASDAMTTASFNVALGTSALSAETQGNRNTAIGHAALAASNTTSNADTYNTAVGALAGLSVTTGVQNTIIGAIAGDDLTTGSGNVLLGYNLSMGNVASDQTICIGYGIASAASNNVKIGVAAGNATLQLNGSDTSWAAASDERLKKNVVDSTAGLSFINDLRPVTFKWNAKNAVADTLPQYDADSSDPVYGEGLAHHGFIAQEVKAVIDSHEDIVNGHGLWIEDPDGTQQVAPSALVPMLVKAIQEQSALITSLTARVAELEG